MALICLALAGCDLTTPKLASGDVSVYEGGRPVRSWPLSQSQIASLEFWLAEHKTGWRPDIVTYVPNTEIRVKAVDGSTWVVNVREATVVVYGQGGQFKQSFAPKDIAPLLAAVGARHDG